jgi:hypothetical protein
LFLIRVAHEPLRPYRRDATAITAIYAEALTAISDNDLAATNVLVEIGNRTFANATRFADDLIWRF